MDKVKPQAFKHLRIEKTGTKYKLVSAMLGMPLGPRLDHGQGPVGPPEIPPHEMDLPDAEKRAKDWETFLGRQGLKQY
jgi:hypothetical protein